MTIYKQHVPYGGIFIPDPLNPTPADPLMKLIDGAGQLMCQAFSNSPGLILPGVVGDLNRGFYEGLCSPQEPPLPAAPAPPFQGGQCPVVYNVVGTYYSKNFSGGFGCNQTQTWRARGIGPIGATYVDSVTNQWAVEYGGNGKLFCLSDASGQPSNSPIVNYTESECVNTTASGYGNSAVVTSVSREDGMPDSCGDPPSEYPPPPDPPPMYMIDIDISSPESSGPINIPLVLVPVNAELNVNPYIDVGGIKIEFTLDGVDLEWDSNKNPLPELPGFNNNPTELLPEAPIPSSEEFPAVENCCSEVNQILDKVNVVLTGSDYNARFNALDQADATQTGKLDELLDDPIIDILVPVGQCLTDQNGLKFYSEIEQLVSSLESAADRTLQSAIWEANKVKLDCEEGDPSKTCVAAIPENWQQMLGATRPRLVQVMRRGATRTYHNYSIPHPANPVQTNTPFLSNFQGGNWLGMVRCNDGSRFQVYCRTKTLAQQLVNEAIALIDPAFLDDPPHVRYTELAGSNISTDLRVATKNVYFEDGNLSSFPTWEAKIPGSDI